MMLSLVILDETIESFYANLMQRNSSPQNPVCREVLQNQGTDPMARHKNEDEIEKCSLRCTVLSSGFRVLRIHRVIPFLQDLFGSDAN